MRALIIGVSGQDGAHLSELLLGKGYEVFGRSSVGRMIAAERGVRAPAGR